MADIVERSAALLLWRPEREAGVVAALERIGCSLPTMGRFSEARGLLLARVAPFQVLALREGVVAPVLDGMAGSIDLADGRVAVRVSGPDARARLSHLVPIDLHPSRFGPGDCAATLVAHLSVLLLQTGPEAYELGCSRSYAGSFFAAVGGLAETMVSV